MTYTVGFDTEFYNDAEDKMTVICAVLCLPGIYKKYWLLNGEDLQAFKDALAMIKRDNAKLLAYAASAEARSLLALGIDPLQFNWIDLYVEFRMLCNSNDTYNYGNYIDDKGEVIKSSPPQEIEEEDEEDEDTHKETPKNLVNALFKMLNVSVDTDQKHRMRDTALSKNDIEITENKVEMMEYCLSDTKYLRALHLALNKALIKEGLEGFEEAQLQRGRYSVAVAKSENLGIPLNTKLLNSIIENTPKILNRYKGTINNYFPFFVPEKIGDTVTLKNGKIRKFKDKPAKKDFTAYNNYIESLNIPNFPRSEKTGKFKFDKQTLVDFRSFNPAIRELLLYNEIEANLKWFNKDNKNGFFERVGSDNKIRPYFGIFGTQTGRNAAKAKTFPLAMSSWLRAIISPEKGQSIIGADFSQQEVYIAAILSEDKKLLEAYNSGDVYLSFAKQSRLVPQDATKTTHKLERTLCKSTVLGIQFGMGKEKLRVKLSNDSGVPQTLEKANELHEAHKNTYTDYWRWVYEITNKYKNREPLITNDGWVLFCDNPSIPSIRNFLVQGNGASITRLAVVKAWEIGLKVMCSLHDAIYIITDNVERDQKLLEEVMIEATASILNQKIEDCTMRIDTKIITPDKYWVEEKGQKDWEELKDYLI